LRLRVASIAFLLATASIGIAWLSLQPVIIRLLRTTDPSSPESGSALQVAAEVRSLLPALLFADLVVVALLIFAVLHFTLSRALSRTEQAIEGLGRVELQDGLPLIPAVTGPILSRVEAAVSRVLGALRDERATTQRQLADLTAAHSQLTRAQTELVAAERLVTVGRLAAGVAHEIGNPLSGILGYLSLARSRERDDQNVQFLELIEKEVLRIDGIVRGLLDLGRPPRGVPQPVVLREVVQACLTLLRKAPELGEVEVSSSVPASAVVLGESGAISQILINVLLNAAQAMQGKGQISLQVSQEPSRLQLHIDDQGPGISAEVRPRLFEPFFTTRTSGGTGLGLAVSLHLAHSMGGSLTAANLPGRGARFTLTLPSA